VSERSRNDRSELALCGCKSKRVSRLGEALDGT